MKNVLKIWLVDNTVTVDNKDDKIGQLESSGNLSLQDILDEMHKEDTGLRPETIEHVVKLYNRVVSDLILSGYSVNTGLYHAVAQLRGVIDGGKWNPEKNSVYVSFTQDKELRETIAQTSISILGERQSVMYVAGFSPATATAGRPFTVNGRMLKIAGTDSSVGITITDSKEQTTPVDLNMLAVNNPSQLTVIVPAGLADGEYTLTVTTQYAGSTLLKTPRTAIATFYVGTKPDAGGGSGSGGSEGGGGEAPDPAA